MGTETESRIVVTRGSGEGKGGGLLFNGHRVSVWDDYGMI